MISFFCRRVSVSAALVALVSPPREQPIERTVRAAKAAIDIVLYMVHLQRASLRRSTGGDAGSRQVPRPYELFQGSASVYNVFPTIDTQLDNCQSRSGELGPHQENFLR